ncbi:hypothetical protein J6590_065081 [Homalodisca vitripennis]|nr:hypothetical protein J6590_065081 [Homalodisca vitripennis]
MAGQAGCLQGQDRSAATHPSSSHARRCLIRLSCDNRCTLYTTPFDSCWHGVKHTNIEINLPNCLTKLFTTVDITRMTQRCPPAPIKDRSLANVLDVDNVNTFRRKRAKLPSHSGGFFYKIVKFLNRGLGKGIEFYEVWDHLYVNHDFLRFEMEYHRRHHTYWL